MSENPNEEPKLIIDEDWKTQVEREREALKKQEAPAEEPSMATPADDETADQIGPPPPASLSLLVTTLATQAMAALGIMPSEDGKTPPVNIGFAKHFIDLIGVLEEKCKGNLTVDEKRYIDDALHQLRMAFVAVSQQAGK